jgi:hypothetical protein
MLLCLMGVVSFVLILGFFREEIVPRSVWIVSLIGLRISPSLGGWFPAPSANDIKALPTKQVGIDRPCTRAEHRNAER